MPSDKRRQLLLLVAGTVAVLMLLWLGVVRWQQSVLVRHGQKIAGLEDDLRIARKGLDLVDQLKAELAESHRRLADLEKEMGQGDLYRWVIKEMAVLQKATKVEITSYELPQAGESLKNVKLPYQTAHFTIAGSAFYHDLGTFLAELENRFPLVQVRRLEVDASGAHTENLEDRERLGFRLEFSNLTKPSAASP